mmetsp:Transcript_10710/g.32275  ORF Transcript_10710/g.32275 Transcript_10710/m.32275 type:complete len:208 (+) Transcript_10710:635-1258(+)
MIMSRIVSASAEDFADFSFQSGSSSPRLMASRPSAVSGGGGFSDQIASSASGVLPPPGATSAPSPPGATTSAPSSPLGFQSSSQFQLCSASGFSTSGPRGLPKSSSQSQPWGFWGSSDVAWSDVGGGFSESDGGGGFSDQIASSASGFSPGDTGHALISGPKRSCDDAAVAAARMASIGPIGRERRAWFPAMIQSVFSPRAPRGSCV